MIPLKTNRRVLIWFCVHPPAEETSKQKRLAYAVFTIFTLTINLLSTAADAAYFYRFMSIDLEDSLMALLQLFGNATMAYVIVAMFVLRHKIHTIFNNLSQIYEACTRNHLVESANEIICNSFFLD